MAYNIKLMKLVTGELVIGKYNEQEKTLNDVGIIQTMPTQEGVQMMLLPYGYPFEQGFCASIKDVHALYVYQEVTDEMQTKYLEACTQLTLQTKQSGIITH